MQIDASHHAWFEDRGPKCHLHLLIDDATSKLMGGYFAPEETTEGYYRACFPYFEKMGRPVSLYSDKRGTFIVNQGCPRHDTQFARAMKELDIRMITAHSPQAKGRIERAFGTLQERLVWEMRLNNISSIEEANVFLPNFLPSELTSLNQANNRDCRHSSI
ncbi:MAG: DDE-type integrase/transposase/recombinase [Parachlamydiaceae bacterium]|nr:DDE-type integrase/transposase/recombinase [Parachlamydiaceae bacterium]